MDDQERRTAVARAIWDDLAIEARTVHCPDHYVGPWRISVMGERAEDFRLYVSGCCPRIGEAVTEMIRRDPRIAATR
jgi:hypothetical protein